MNGLPRLARRFRTPVLLVVAAAVAVLLGPGNAMGAFTRPIANTNNTAAVNFTCTQAASATGSAYFVWPLNEAAGTAAADVSGNARPGTYSTTGVAYGAAGPCPRDTTGGGKSVTLSGLITGGFIAANTAIAGPSTFSEAIWFNTTSATGGRLIGFGNSNSVLVSNNFDRMMYLTAAGRLIFGIYSGGYKTIQSPLSYNDGTWHQAVATFGATGMRLYLDGQQVASDTTTTTAQSIPSGYWRVGYDAMGAWPSAGSAYFPGRVAFAQVYTTVLTPSQVQGQYTVGGS